MKFRVRAGLVQGSAWYPGYQYRPISGSPVPFKYLEGQCPV